MAKQKTILVVDDEADLREMIQYQLETKGYHVETAVDGIDALRKLENVEPDLIILDINMPRMGGIEFYSKICREGDKPSYPVFILTARANVEQLFKSIDVDGFMTKPFDIQQLCESVECILEEKRERKKDESPQEGSGRNYLKQIIIVDTDPASLSKLACKFLESGFVVGIAKNGASACERIIQRPPDFALIKLELNDIRGDKVIFELKKNMLTRNTKYILFSGKESKDISLTDHFRKKSGVDAFIESTDTSELLNAVEKEMLA